MKILDKIAEVFIAIGNDMKNRLVASPPTAAGQVLVSKDVEGQVVAVWDDVANLGLTGGGTPVASQLVFSDMQNVSYNDNILSYDGGELPGLGGFGQAITDKPINIEYELVTQEGVYVYIFLGEYSDISMMDSGDAKGVLMGVDGEYLTVDGKSRTLIQISGEPSSSLGNNGDIIRITIENNHLTVRNIYQNTVYATPTSQYLNNPKYLGIFSNSPSFTVYGLN